MCATSLVRELDIDLLRALLLHVEEHATRPHSELKDIVIDGWGGEQIAHHVALASEEGLIKATIEKLPDANGYVTHVAYSVHRLTWAGHELLDAVRADRNWRAIKKRLREVNDHDVRRLIDMTRGYLKDEFARVFSPLLRRALPENETVKTEAEHSRAENAERRSDDREAMRVSADFTDHPAIGIELDGLLYLTVPHLSRAVEDHSERDQKRILVACDGRRDGNRHAGHDKRNGPLAMIAQFLGIHFRPAPFAEIITRFHLAEGSGFTQEVILPQGWRALRTPSSGWVSARDGADTQPEERKESIMAFRFELGAEAVETVTGFKGFITGRAEYIAGCRQYGLTPKAKEDAAVKTEWFDEERISVTGQSVSIAATPTGGPSGSDCAPSR